MRLVSFILFSVIALASSAPSAVASTPGFARWWLGHGGGFANRGGFVRNNILGCHNPKQILPECEVPIEYYQPLSVSELWRGPNELRREDRPAARAEWPTSCRRGSHLPRQRRSRPRC
jgi:hypothetical protein